jgi:hypothetical protein
MTDVASVAFLDDYTPDGRAIEAAVAVLDEGRPVEVLWPERTVQVLTRKEAGRSTILADLVERGGGATGVEQYDALLGEARRFAAAADRLLQLSRALKSAGATAEQTARGIATFLRLANLRILASLARIELEGEDLPLEGDLRNGLLNELFNSTPGRRARDTTEKVHSADIRQEGREPNVDVFAPRSVIGNPLPGDTVQGELLFRWVIPQFELHLIGSEAEYDYRPCTLHVVKTRDSDFVER